MSQDNRLLNPQDAFRSFLERAENDAWIASYKWFRAESFGLLKNKLKYPCPENVSRSHKRSTDGTWWALDVEAHDGTKVGVDLELFVSRPVLERPEWISERLSIARGLSPQKILEEWCSREAAFKAFAPENQKILLSQIRKSPQGNYAVFSPQGERSCQVRLQMSGRWIVSLAWRSIN